MKRAALALAIVIAYVVLGRVLDARGALMFAGGARSLVVPLAFVALRLIVILVLPASVIAHLVTFALRRFARRVHPIRHH